MGDQPSQPSVAELQGRRLSVGIALTTDPHTTRGLLTQLCLALADATGMEVEPTGVLHYQTLLDGVAQGELDLVWLPPIPALRAAAAGQIVPLALPVRRGASAYSTALFTRPDAPWRTVADLVGVHAAWADRQSAAGYLIIRAHLRALGVDLARAFTKESFVGTHDAVARAVLEGRADVGASFAYFQADDTQLVQRAGWGDAKVHIITQAGPIPSDLVAASTRLPALVTRLVQAALVDGQNVALMRAAKALLGADGFVAPRHEHLEPLRALLAGLEGDARGSASILPPPMPAGHDPDDLE
ncbi:MAG: PhnD/SsuA/transferrin family substrate-binding protein [Polyangiaceae bacterium]|nr:PhnD/SsuA/transferrin family substrate-binding protein [Polyangiaceae bacterium]